MIEWSFHCLWMSLIGGRPHTRERRRLAQQGCSPPRRGLRSETCEDGGEGYLRELAESRLCAKRRVPEVAAPRPGCPVPARRKLAIRLHECPLLKIPDLPVTQNASSRRDHARCFELSGRLRSVCKPRADRRCSGQH